MTSLLNSYFTLNMLIILFSLLCLIARKLNPSLRLKFQYAGLALLLIVPIIQPFFPKPDFTKPIVKIWEGSQGFNNAEIPQATSSFMTFTAMTDDIRIETSSFFTTLCLLLFFMLSLTLWTIIKDLRILSIMKRNALLLKKNGKIRVYSHSEMTVPFSYWLPGQYNSFIPHNLLADQASFRISLLHEFQHHRQGDTKWLFSLMILKSFCFFNPFVHWLEKEISETQEFSCDENLLTKKNINDQDYIRCLVQVAQTAVSAKMEPVCATGFCFSRGQNILKRRITNMISNQKMTRRINYLALVLVSTFVLTAVSWGSRNMVQDRKITMEEAEALIKNQSEFPLVVNDSVLAQLNRYLGTPEGRSFFAQAMERKKEFNQILESKNSEYGTPAELNAIPVVESGYVNRKMSSGAKAAGLWMFIPGTARKFGMKVNNTVDERLNVTKETDAAHRYLLSNKLLFNDWHLSLLAYNVGEGRVDRGIKKFNTRNAWELIEKGIVGDKDYLPSVMAAMIIMKNPGLLE